MRKRDSDLILKNNKDIKKKSYRILKKLYDLNRRRKLNRIYSKKTSNEEYYVVKCFENFEQFMLHIIDKTENPENLTYSKYVERLNLLVNEIKGAAQSNTRINKKKVSGFLKYHTKIFNNFNNRKSTLEIDEGSQENWHDFIITSISTWGHEYKMNVRDK